MVSTNAAPLLSERFEEALLYAAQLHKSQLRKGTDIPYISHLLAVTALVLEDGGDEDEAISALLHDAVEDQGGVETRREILRRFGERVARIVDGCSDCTTLPKPPWQSRKEQHLAHLRTASPSVARVCAADKLHNARCMLADYRREGEAIWSKFTRGKRDILWYYRGTLKSLGGKASDRLLNDLARVVAELERLSET